MTESDIWIETFTGKKFYLLKPRAEDVDLVDIATSLSHQTRFVGHLAHTYSVAEHCLWAWKLAELLKPKDYLFQLHAQLHDAEEAYTGDLSHPYKQAMHVLGAGDVLNRIAHGIHMAIFERLRLEEPGDDMLAELKGIDDLLLATEHKCPALMPNGGEHQWPIDTHVEPCAALLNGHIDLDPHSIAPSRFQKPFAVRFPATVALQHPPDSALRTIAWPLFPADLAALYFHNAERLLTLIRAERSATG